MQEAWKGTCPRSWTAEWCRPDFPGKPLPCPYNFMRFIKSSDMVFRSCCPVTEAAVLFISIKLSFYCPFCNIHDRVCFCGSAVLGKPCGSVSFHPHQEENPRLLPVQAPHVMPNTRIAASGPHMSRLRPDGHGRISSPGPICPGRT